MPAVSKAQNRWLHTGAAEDALGKKGQSEWIGATHDVKDLPERTGKGGTTGTMAMAAEVKPMFKKKAKSDNDADDVGRGGSTGYGCDTDMTGKGAAGMPGMGAPMSGGGLPKAMPARKPKMRKPVAPPMMPPPQMGPPAGAPMGGPPPMGGGGPPGMPGMGGKNDALDAKLDKSMKIKEGSKEDLAMDRVLGVHDNPGKGGSGNWIAGAIKHPGALHRKLNVPEGEKIPASKMAQAEHSSNPTERKEASLAHTLAGFHGKGGSTAVGRGGTGSVRRLGNTSSSGRPPAQRY